MPELLTVRHHASFVCGGCGHFGGQHLSKAGGPFACTQCPCADGHEYTCRLCGVGMDAETAIHRIPKRRYPTNPTGINGWTYRRRR